MAYLNEKFRCLPPIRRLQGVDSDLPMVKKLFLSKEIAGSWVLLQKSKLKTKELTNLLQTLQKCMKSGAGITKALEIAASGAKHPLTRGIIGVLLFNTGKNGLQLSVAMQKMSSVFDSVMIAMVKAGEFSGKLPFILEDLAKRLEQTSTVKSKTMASLYYPMFILGMTMAGATVVNFFVFPSIMSNFKMMNAKLPKVTQLMMDFVGFTGNNPWLLLIPVVGIVILFFKQKTNCTVEFFPKATDKDSDCRPIDCWCYF